MSLMTTLERRMARNALAQLLAGGQDLNDGELQAAASALEKLNRPDPARKLRECLEAAFEAFAHDDDGRVWADSLIRRTRRVLKQTDAWGHSRQGPAASKRSAVG